MFLVPRINAPWRGRIAAVLPWAFILGMVTGAMLVGREGASWWPRAADGQIDTQAARDSETIWKRAGNPSIRHPVDVLRTVDGDTFEARVHLWPGLELVTKVRLRGIDAPELKAAACPQELALAETASNALRTLLSDGEVAIYNIGPDKYGGRVVADAATRKTPNVSSALITAGHVRSYGGGRRAGWCNSASR